MITSLVSTIIATCLSGSSYTGSTQVTLDRSDDQFSYHMVAEATKGPDGDGQDGVIADVTTSSMNAIHMEDGMLYEFEGWELEIFGVWTQPYDAELRGELRQLDQEGKAISTTALTCDFND
jgi:hypothetical protein